MSIEQTRQAAAGGCGRQGLGHVAALPSSFCLSLISPTYEPCPCFLPRILHLLSAAINSLAQVGAERTVPGPYQERFLGVGTFRVSGARAGILDLVDLVSKWGREEDGQGPFSQ